MKALGALVLLLFVVWGLKNWKDSKPPILINDNLDDYLNKLKRSRDMQLQGFHLSGRDKHLADTASLIDFDQEFLN